MYAWVFVCMYVCMQFQEGSILYPILSLNLLCSLSWPQIQSNPPALET